MICCVAARNAPMQNVPELVRRAHCCKSEIRAVYDAGVNLEHYGEMDHLAPAGAMAEFVVYVREQSRKEAEDAFADLRAEAARFDLRVRVYVAHGRDELLSLMRQWNCRVFPEP